MCCNPLEEVTYTEALYRFQSPEGAFMCCNIRCTPGRMCSTKVSIPRRGVHVLQHNPRKDWHVVATMFQSPEGAFMCCNH